MTRRGLHSPMPPNTPSPVTTTVTTPQMISSAAPVTNVLPVRKAKLFPSTCRYIPTPRMARPMSWKRQPWRKDGSLFYR